MTPQKQNLHLKGRSEEKMPGDALPGFVLFSINVQMAGGQRILSRDWAEECNSNSRPSHLLPNLRNSTASVMLAREGQQQEIGAVNALQTQDLKRCLSRGQRSDKLNLTHKSLGFLTQVQLQMKPTGYSPITSAKVNCSNCSRCNSQTLDPNLAA